ncbi:hypothetical protein ACFQ3L_04600 [Lacticaseibacillus jixianensis]|uniref:Mga helix-turn-helix domain-containing protein n=1 Tax=Lacticaseibacillus jixianensis TaxID=2486012 RepID=A0ABW4B7C9_9LACO|nr:hypothetical protein [Lacticaseibacillus jixianensis]
MNASAIFNAEDQASYQVLQMISNAASQTVAESALQEQFGLTKYKLNKLFDTLNADLVAVSTTTPSYLDDLEKGFWRAHHLTKVILQKLRLMYLQRGYLFTVFEYQFFFSNRTPKNKYMQEHFISNAKFYEASAQLKGALADDFLTPHAEADTEFATRLALFQFYFVAYNGIASPFKELDPTVAALIRTLEAQLEVALLPTQVTKLRFFLKIWLLRMMNGQHIQNVLPGDITLPGADGCLDGVHKILPKQFGVTTAELDYLYAFLGIWHYLPDTQGAALISAAHLPQAAKMTTDFIHLVQTHHILEDGAKPDLSALHDALFGLHVQMVTFYLAPTTFIDDQQISFFANLYPAFDALILTFISQLVKAGDPVLNRTMAVNLYFSYMFTLINYLPPEALRDKVYVCVDFAQGPIYTDYISRTLSSFDNAFIVIEHRLSKHTDVYLSDFSDPQLTMPQVTWANPPSPADWRELADLTVRVKQTKMQAVVPQTVSDPFSLKGKEASDD